MSAQVGLEGVFVSRFKVALRALMFLVSMYTHMDSETAGLCITLATCMALIWFLPIMHTQMNFHVGFVVSFEAALKALVLLDTFVNCFYMIVKTSFRYELLIALSASKLRLLLFMDSFHFQLILLEIGKNS